MSKLFLSAVFLFSILATVQSQCYYNCNNGFGIMKYKNGSIYQGLWKFGQPNGIGIKIYTNGKKKEGVWSNGTFMESRKVSHRIKTIADSIANEVIGSNSDNIYNVPINSDSSKVKQGELPRNTIVSWISYQIQNHPILIIIAFIGGLCSIYAVVKK